MKWGSSRLMFMHLLTWSIWTRNVPFVNIPVIINDPFFCNIFFNIFQYYLYILEMVYWLGTPHYFGYFSIIIYVSFPLFPCGWNLQIKIGVILKTVYLTNTAWPDVEFINCSDKKLLFTMLYTRGFLLMDPYSQRLYY